MKKNLLFALGLSAVMASSAMAQTTAVRNCGTMQHLSDLQAADPMLAARMQQIEQQTAQILANSAANKTAAIVTIPVVFHVVYANATQNISDAKCIAQLNQLNLDYARLNSDASSTPAAFQGLAANTQIQFCLAQRDPNGNATTGIIHKSTTTASFSSNDNVKRTANGGDNAWDATKYLNIWSCNLSGGLLGYAQFPGGAASTDGVVCLYSSIGSMTSPGTATPYHLGRTMTHEVGHWLNLRHIWGDASCGNDLVSDTPTQSTSNFGCPTFPHTTCSNGANGDMFMNYMDYTDDGCMNMFTAGQSARMAALFATGGARVGLTTSLGCQAPTASCGVPASLSASAVTFSSATLNWGAVSGAVTYNVQYRAVGAASWSSASTASTSLAISGLSEVTNYEFQVQCVCAALTSAYSASGNFTTLSSVVTCGAVSGLTASSLTSSSATLAWTAVSGANSYNVQYRIVGAASWTSTTSTTNSKAISGLTASSNYEFQVQSVCTGASSAFSASSNFTTSAIVVTCSDAYEANNSSSAAKVIPMNTDITALINKSSDVDWYKFTTVAPNTKVKVTVTNLPADYDVKMYNSSVTLLYTSQNGGTTSEQIIRNSTTATTLYLKVYGYSSAFNASSCYTLRVSTGSANFRIMPGEDVDVSGKASTDGISLYPNPVKESLNILYTSDVELNSTLQVTDQLGRVVVEKSQELNAGENKFAVDVHSLARGIYFVSMTVAGEFMVQKFVVE
ncbi:MAG: fibronectin type III domain-containing protein [Bacteroidetes bacterium]|nr:fibronectin type III domain-containing protein [Bacteroidota bacterium]